ncbi:hypothetical protein ACS0TY_006349 [Phlomoides rotata]
MEVYANYIFLGSILLLFIAIINGLKKRKLQLPPGPNGLPFLGSLITIGSRPHESVSHLAKIYGPLMTLKLGFINVVVVSSPEMSMEILQKHDLQLSGRQVPDAVTAEYGYRLALPWLPIGPQWRKLRKIFNTHISTPHKLDSLQDLRHKVMERMTRRIIEAGEDSIDIGGIVFDSVTHFLSHSVFSIDILDPSSDAMKQLQRLIANIMVLSAKPNVTDYFPFLRPFDVQGIRRKISKSYDRLHQLIDDMIDRRMHQRKSCRGSHEAAAADILDVLLDFTQVEGHEGLTLLDVKLLITEIYIAGTDTTTTTIEWAMSELIRNPTVQLKLKQELNEKIELGKRVQEKDILQLPYLTAVIKETMRLHPISPFLLPHQAEQQVELQGFTIPKDTPIWVNFWSISRDPTYWDEPTRFIPERFLTSDMNFRGSNFSFTPFSAGRRTCPGLNLATRMVSLLLATLLHSFDWKLPEGVTPDAMDMTDMFGITLKKAQPLSLIPSKIII